MATLTATHGDAAELLASPLTQQPLINISHEDPICSSAVEKRSQEKENNEVADELRFKRSVDELTSQMDELEQKVNEVSEFYANRKRQNEFKGTSDLKDKEKSNSNNNTNSGGNNSCTKKPVDGSKQHAACSKRMQELMRQFGTILRQISQHKWAWPFMEPVDVEGLGLHDYYEIIKKPMDLSTIRNQMEAKDDTGYRNVSDIYADARLVFTNAMTYNDERNDIHVMAKTLLAKLEEKWLLLWPKVVEEEKRLKEEETQALANMQLVHEISMARMAADVENELNDLNSQLDELREMVVKKSRKWSTEEKRKLGAGLSTLSTEDLNKALEIIAQSNPDFQTAGEVVEFDMDAQSETTLWRLKFFVKEAWEHQNKISSKKDNGNLKRKEFCEALAKTARKRSKKPGSS
ncbi:transcription factor GTE1-like isoform X1 [Phalaenopsis equestris]|uniref:transcription factor GTE1-like isoform X1 n=1 Tax=Phalaenopsis equestris TaxID=78828 RepID=UPI0009E5E8DF|nr:transcription factor GTE1-like isoform X1 [Phalaenopsis equestris]XP_020581614.1 transcription factor GTE1-like isoform X1 [Phalaenopsis equestris]